MKALLVSFPGPSYLVGAMERSIQVKSLDEDEDGTNYELLCHFQDLLLSYFPYWT